MHIFEQAARNKLRFSTQRGFVPVEQLFDMPLLSKDGFCLDSVARKVYSELKDISEGSFVEDRVKPEKALLELKLEIIKHVIKSIQEANAAKREAYEAEQRRQLLRAALHGKQVGKINEMSEEEIQAELTKSG